MSSLLSKRVFVAGHAGMVGSAIVRTLATMPDIELLVRTRAQLNLLNQPEVDTFFCENRFDVVYMAAARVGGIHANYTYPADFIYENLTLQNNVIMAAQRSGVRQLLFLGSSCIYPRVAPQPITESALLSGELEPTNEPYAIAKIAGIKLCESLNRQYGTDYRSIMPTNLYGPGDNFHSENSHVMPALIRRFHAAKESGAKSVKVWGSGRPLREFLYVDDLANACVTVMNISRGQWDNVTDPMNSHVNVGTGTDCSIAYLAERIASVVGFTGDIEWDSSKPDGTPRKLLDVGKLKQLGWTAQTSLESGLRQTYEWYLCNQGIRQ